MIVTPEFPEHRLQDPRRQAEWRVYQEIAGSQAPGRALYEMRAGLHVPQLDFGIWLQDVAHYGLQVKGGETATAGGEWRLHSANGPETIPSPIAQTFDAAIAIRDIIKAQLHRKVFIFPVLCFPDMVPDPIIEARAAEGHVTVLWGGDDLIGRMKELAKTQTIHRPPTAERIAQEVELIQPGMGHPAGLPAPRRRRPMRMRSWNCREAGWSFTSTSTCPGPADPRVAAVRCSVKTNSGLQAAPGRPGAAPPAPIS